MVSRRPKSPEGGEVDPKVARGLNGDGGGDDEGEGAQAQQEDGDGDGDGDHALDRSGRRRKKMNFLLST